MAWFHTVGIIGKSPNGPRVAETVARLVVHLRRRGVALRFSPEMAALMQSQAALADPATGNGAGIGAAIGAGPIALSLEEMGRRCDLIVVVGGDGTLLAAARAMSDFEVPLVGINLGRLGFLVDISPDEIEGRLDQVLSGKYDADTRTLIDVQIGDQPGVAGATPTLPAPDRGRALNDVVISKWNTVRMIEFETYIDGHCVNIQRADGIIIATPTGSTAYALSGGGPLIHPSLDALLLVPICPHTLSNRPLVVPGDARIEVRIRNFEPDQVRLTCDGQIDLAMATNAPIRVERSRRRIRLLHPRGHDHYSLLRAKLGWGGQPVTAAANAVVDGS